MVDCVDCVLQVASHAVAGRLVGLLLFRHVRHRPVLPLPTTTRRRSAGRRTRGFDSRRGGRGARRLSADRRVVVPVVFLQCNHFFILRIEFVSLLPTYSAQVPSTSFLLSHFISLVAIQQFSAPFPKSKLNPVVKSSVQLVGHSFLFYLLFIVVCSSCHPNSSSYLLIDDCCRECPFYPSSQPFLSFYPIR